MKAIAMITPSANLVVERVTTKVLADFPEVSGHFTRVAVTGAHDPSATAYPWDEFIAAARLLADAEPDVIVWNGTMGAGLGFAADVELCRRITAATGLPSTTATLAIERLLGVFGVRRIGMVTPYDDVYQANILRSYERAGFQCVAEQHAGLQDNIAYCRLTDSDIAGMVERVAPSLCEGIVMSCTNMAGAELAGRLERQYGRLVLDSTLCAVHEGLRLAGVERLERGAARWGRIFSDPRAH